ncbi:MAG: hypothetical protein JO163_17925 [Methylobacteriaceae bacterium]|nr:hypothetical protein [Methylobacteriaceae bacterium]MBV9704610.1 hypothetical protein [Methylobacteriaceae bacterium]
MKTRIALALGVSLAAAACRPGVAETTSTDAAKIAACTAQADSKHLYGPERWDFRQKCVGRGPTFAEAKFHGQCKHVVELDGEEGEAKEKLGALPKSTASGSEQCQLYRTILKAASDALKIINEDSTKCGYADTSIAKLTRKLDKYKADKVCAP